MSRISTEIKREGLILSVNTNKNSKEVKSRGSIMRILFILSTFILLCTAAFGQVTVKLQQPPPNQLSINDLWNASITNSSEEPINVTLICTLEKTDAGIIAEGNSGSITLIPGMKSITYDDVKSGNSSTIFDRWGNLKTGSGDYIISMQVQLNSSGGTLASESIFQRIDIKTQPSLVSPEDGETVPSEEPVLFTWLPPVPEPPDQTYKIKIVEIIGNQSPEEAMVGNKPIFESDRIGELYFQYFSSESSFVSGNYYAWRIDAGESEDSKSEVRSFYFGQRDACITWDLLTSVSVTSAFGNIIGQNENIGAGPVPTMSVFDYTSNGQRLWVGNTGWVAGSLDVTRYIEFNTSPISGNNFSVTYVSFNYGDNQIATEFFILNSQVYYSIDNWATSTALSQTPLVYLNSSMSTFTASNLNVMVSSGQTFSLRIYPYAVQNGRAGTPTFAIHNDVMICGITTPQVVTDGTICGIKFNDLNGNGEMDLNEPGLSNWTINLTGATSRTTVTNSDGTYCFDRLKAGVYNVAEINQTGWVQTMPASPGTYSVSLTSGQELENINFGNKYDPDASCPKVWKPLGSGMNDEVFAYAQAGNIIYAGGDFTMADGTQANYIAKWDGTSWTPLGSGLNGKVRAIAVMGSDVYVGGMFTIAGGVSASRIAKWDGTNWSALGNGVNGSVLALKVLGTDLYVGGSFTNASGVITNCLAKWDGTNWSSPGGGIYDFGDYMSVRALVVLGSDLYVGGGYYSLSGLGLGFTAKWDGISWSNQNTFSGRVDALAVIGTDLYVAGWFFQRIRKWDGTSWTTPGGGMNNHIHALAVIGSDLYAGGAFTTAGGVNTYRVAKWNGTAWSALGNGVSNWSGSHGHVEALLADGNELHVGGGFDVAGTVNANYAAKYVCSTSTTLNTFVLGSVFHDLNDNGFFEVDEPVLPNWNVNVLGAEIVTSFTNSDGNFYFNTLKPGVYTIAVKIPSGWVSSGNTSGSHTFDLGPGQNLTGINFGVKPIFCTDETQTWSPLGRGADGQVSDIVELGGNIYAGGSFTNAGGIVVNHIAKWDGSAWSGLGSGINGNVNALAVLGMDLYAGGSFTTAGGVSASSIAKWDGTNWSALGTGINGTVNALAVINDDLYAGGNFNMAGGINTNNIAKWDGVGWTALSSGTSSYLYALAVMGGDLYAGGVFTSAGGININKIAKWDGLNWSSLGSGVTSTVYSIAELDGELYVGGDFPTAGGVSVNRIAKWDGTNWSALGTGIDNNYVRSIASIGSDIYAGGDFTTIGGMTVNYISKWDGTNWSALGTGMNQNYVQTIAAVGGDLYAGGWFSTADGISASNIAKYSCSALTSIDDNTQNLPLQFKLEQNYPNPFNPSSTIKFDIPKASFVKIIVYDILGREIKVLLNEEKSPGSYKIIFDAKNLSSGVYIYSIKAGDFSQSKKMILLK